MRFNKPCLDCGTLTKESRCEPCATKHAQQKETNPTRVAHKRFMYGPNYRRLAPIIKANAIICHICKQGPKLNDPWEADHLYPHLGDASPLAPAHKSCNQARGNTPLE